MSVDFTASVIYGFHVSRDEFNDLKDRIGEDEVWEVYDDYMMTADGYDEDSDLFFVIKEIAITEEWVEIEHLVNVITPQIAEEVTKFRKLFPNRVDRPRYYLIRKVW